MVFFIRFPLRYNACLPIMRNKSVVKLKLLKFNTET